MGPNTDMQSAMQMIQLGIMILAVALVGGVAALAGMVRCYKNQHLSKTARGLWLGAQMLLMFPAFIYLILVDHSPWWRAVGIVALFSSLLLVAYITQNPSLTALPDLPAISGM